MKALIFSDVHVHDYKQHNIDGKRASRAAEVIRYVFKLASANEISYIMFTGDLGDQFANISVIAMNELIFAFNECFDKYPGIEFIAIPGNHDFAYKNTFKNPAPSVMDAFAASGIYTTGLFGNFIQLANCLYHQPQFGSIMGIPFFEDIDDFWKSLEVNTPDTKLDGPMYLLMHQMIWPENDIVQDDVDFNDDRFKQFDWVFNGHVHHPSMFGNNFINVGSPLHRDASDIDDKKGLWLLDTEKDLPAFWDITDKHPQYISRPYGHKLTDWENEQYVTWFHPADKKKKKKDTFDASKFNVKKVLPMDLANNFLTANEDKLDFPKADLMSVATKYFE